MTLRLLLPLSALLPLCQPALAQDYTWYHTALDQVSSIDTSQDFDGDGRHDGVVGDGVNRKVVVISGTGATLQTYLGSTSRFGERVAALPDLTADGIPEVLITSAAGFDVYKNATSTLLYSSASALTTVPSIAVLEDANGDGYADLAVGQRSYGLVGRVQVFSGRYMVHGLGPEVLFTRTGPTTGSGFGYSVEALPDVDGDGRTEVAVSAPYEEGQSGFFLYRGRIHVLDGATGATLWIDEHWNPSGGSTPFQYGIDMACVGDQNGDGVEDLLVGAPGVIENGVDSGAAYLISGAGGGTLGSMYGPSSNWKFGSSVSIGPDLDFDGRPDFLVGWAGGPTSVSLMSSSTLQASKHFNYNSGTTAFIGCMDGGHDMSGDGLPDLLLANNGSFTQVFLYEGNCTGIMAPEEYCDTKPNSVAPNGARIGYTGTPGISNGNLRLRALDCPPNQSALFFMGQGSQTLPFADGYLCVWGTLYRYPIVSTGASGTPSWLMDYDATPATLIQPGSYWCFQCWYRDPFGPLGTGSNLSDGLKVYFCP